MSKTKLLPPEQISESQEVTHRILQELNRMLLGQEKLHRLLLAGILSRGHILLEGLPGVGKTSLIRSLGQILELKFARIQFTPDLMPSDILGSHILEESPEGRRMQFHPGPVFTNILLADEINRASPKTQSALLEAMQERSVTLLGCTHSLPAPFFVLASQNPIELEGTYPLPEAQLDRFLFKLDVTEVNPEVLDRIISERRHGQLPEPTWKLERGQLETLFEIADQIYLPKAVSQHISVLVSATHPESPAATENVRNYVRFGASPRAAISIAEAARAEALISGRPTVGFEDVHAVASRALNHRLICNYQAKLDQITVEELVEELIGKLEKTALDLPTSVRIESPS